MLLLPKNRWKKPGLETKPNPFQRWMFLLLFKLKAGIRQIWVNYYVGDPTIFKKENLQPKDELSYLTIAAEVEEVSLVASVQNAHHSDINGIQFVDDNTIVTAGFDKMLHIWKITQSNSSSSSTCSLTRSIKAEKYSHSACDSKGEIFVVCSLGGYLNIFHLKVTNSSVCNSMMLVQVKKHMTSCSYATNRLLIPSWAQVCRLYNSSLMTSISDNEIDGARLQGVFLRNQKLPSSVQPWLFGWRR